MGKCSSPYPRLATDGGNVVTGPAANAARTAAVRAVPGGRAGTVSADSNADSNADSDSDEGNAAYDVAVTKPDGSTVTVQLDRNDHLLSVRPADQQPDDGDGG